MPVNKKQDSNKNNNSINLNSTKSIAPSDSSTNPEPPPLADHESKVNALAAMMSDLASTASSSLTGSDAQPSTNFNTSSNIRDRWT